MPEHGQLPLEHAERLDTSRTVVPAHPAMFADEPDPTAIVRAESPDALFRLAFEKGGATPEALGQLIALRSQMRREAAELSFFRAMAEFQKRCAPVPRTSKAEIITKSGGKFGYLFADFEQIMEVVRPPANELGLSFTFSSKTDGKNLTCILTARHEHGHSVELSSFTLPTDTASAMSAQQAVGAALTFAKRQCITAGLGLSLTDPDPDNQGDPSTITDEQRSSLLALHQEVGGDLRKFLAIYGVERLEDMPARNYKGAVATLEGRRKRT